MKLAKFRLPSGKVSVGLYENESIRPLAMTGGQYQSLTDILEAGNIDDTVKLLIDESAEPLTLSDVTLLAPIDRQEVWAAGVTYTRSRTARMEESKGGATFYDKVYDAPRPELFFKATPERVAHPNHAVRVRRDSAWSVPEPELALVLNSRLELVGYTIGNDMSARDIEGENPLYLPQAKVYDECCALGPCVTLHGSMPHRDRTEIRLAVIRNNSIVFEGSTSVGRMARSFEDLIAYLAREQTFRNGVILLTGTGIVPPDEFALRHGDSIDIAIEGIGTLSNTVVRG